MEGDYPIFMAGKEIGLASVKREGLYWKIFCSCKISGEVLYRIVVKSSSAQENLGILVPDNDCFVLSTRISMKRLALREPIFLAVPKHSQTEGKFVAIYPDEPFAYLDRIKKSRFGIKDHTPGMYIAE